MLELNWPECHWISNSMCRVPGEINVDVEENWFFTLTVSYVCKGKKGSTCLFFLSCGRFVMLNGRREAAVCAFLTSQWKSARCLWHPYATVWGPQSAAVGVDCTADNASLFKGAGATMRVNIHLAHLHCSSAKLGKRSGRLATIAHWRHNSADKLRSTRSWWMLRRTHTATCCWWGQQRKFGSFPTTILVYLQRCPYSILRQLFSVFTVIWLRSVIVGFPQVSKPYFVCLFFIYIYIILIVGGWFVGSPLVNGKSLTDSPESWIGPRLDPEIASLWLAKGTATFSFTY